MEFPQYAAGRRFHLGRQSRSMWTMGSAWSCGPATTTCFRRFNGAIDKVLKNGTYLRVNARYFPFDIS